MDNTGCEDDLYNVDQHLSQFSFIFCTIYFFVVCNRMMRIQNLYHHIIIVTLFKIKKSHLASVFLMIEPNFLQTLKTGSILVFIDETLKKR